MLWTGKNVSPIPSATDAFVDHSRYVTTRHLFLTIRCSKLTGLQYRVCHNEMIILISTLRPFNLLDQSHVSGQAVEQEVNDIAHIWILTIVNLAKQERTLGTFEWRICHEVDSGILCGHLIRNFQNECKPDSIATEHVGGTTAKWRNIGSGGVGHFHYLLFSHNLAVVVLPYW